MYVCVCARSHVRVYLNKLSLELPINYFNYLLTKQTISFSHVYSWLCKPRIITRLPLLCFGFIMERSWSSWQCGIFQMTLTLLVFINKTLVPMCRPVRFRLFMKLMQIFVFIFVFLCFCLWLQVNEIYNDQSLGAKINVVLVRMIMLGKDKVRPHSVLVLVKNPESCCSWKVRALCLRQNHLW